METKNKLVLIGGSGHCKSVLDSLSNSNQWDDIIILDPGLPIGHHVNGYRVIGDDSKLEDLFRIGYSHAFISIGSVGDTTKRRSIYALLKTIGYSIPTIIDFSANVSKHTKIGEGTFIGKNVVINSDTDIGYCSIINTGAIIEHDCKLGDFVHVAPGAVLSGSVIIGDDTHIGANSSIRNNITVGSRTIIGIGSVVVKNLESGKIAYGNPCKEVS